MFDAIRAVFAAPAKAELKFVITDGMILPLENPDVIQRFRLKGCPVKDTYGEAAALLERQMENVLRRPVAESFKDIGYIDAIVLVRRQDLPDDRALDAATQLVARGQA